MTRYQLEKRYHEFGLDNYILKTIQDLENIHNINYESVVGYMDLDHDQQIIYRHFIIKFFNAFGLDNRATIQPLAVYWVESQDKVAVESDGSLVWVGGTIVAIDRRHNRMIVDDWFDNEYVGCEIQKEIKEYYLRFEYMMNGRKEWLHIIKNGNEWY